MPGRQATIEYARRGLRRLAAGWQDLVIVTCLVALFVYVQRFPDGLDPGGDAVSKWQFARQWSYANDFRHATWTHHMTRMGVNAVAFIAQKLCGSGWRTYYVAPMFMGALQLVLVYALGRRISGRLCGVLAALVATFLPAVHTSVSQLLPDGFAGTYALLATYLLARYAEAAPRRALPLLLAAGVAGFVGYLAKETFFFFFPGLGIAVLLLRRRLRDGFIFAGVLLAGLGLETACYSLFTNYPHRLAIVRSVHFAGAEDEPPSEVSFRGFWEIFRRLDAEWTYLLIAGALGAVALLFANRRAPALGRALVAIALSHIVLLGVSAQLWQNPLPRYMDPVIGLVALGGAYLVATIALRTLALTKLVPSLASYGDRLSRWLESPYLALALVLPLTLGLAYRDHKSKREEPPFDGRAHGELMARLTNETYQRNLPMAHRSRRAKTLAAVYDVYLDAPSLVRDGVLPSFEDVLRRASKFTYLVKDPTRYDAGVFERLREAGCVLELRNTKRRGIRTHADAVRHSSLPARCDALLERVALPKK